jgi:hypothetical protein
MSHFALTLDPDPKQRGAFLAAARQLLETLPGVEVQTAEVGSLALVWSRGKNTPLSIQSSPTSFSLLMGYAVTEAGEHLSAERLLALRHVNSPELDGLDGYFLGIVSPVEGTLSVLSDPLGLFPIYTSVRGEALIVASSPGGCLAHPACPNILDARGLAGILLVNGLVGERTLIQGVRRLRAGCMLERTPQAEVLEREIFRLEPEETWQESPFEEILEKMEGLMLASIQRHRPPEAKSSLLLSGGLDSRLMAACLSAEGVAYQPFTWGRPEDFEMRAARAVVEKLGLPLVVEEDAESPETAVKLARRLALWYDIPSSSSGLGERADGEAALGTVAPYFWSGFIFDVTLGGLCMPVTLTNAQNGSFEDSFFDGDNKWGFTPEVVKALLRPVLGADEVDACVEEVKRAIALPELSPRQKGFSGTLQIRVRYLLGMTLHRLSAQAWPLLPFLERRQLQFLFNQKIEFIQKRRLEMMLLQKINPRLLEVPLDTNSFRFGRLQAKKGGALNSWPLKLKVRLLSHLSRWYWRHWKHSDPRRYYRLYDLNSSAWRAVRQAVEPLRTDATRVFDSETLLTLLPPATVPLHFERPFTAGTSRHNLIGVILWLAQQSPIVTPRETRDG